MSGKKSIESLLKLCDFSKWTGHDKILKNLVMVNCKEGHLQAEFRVTNENLNYVGGLHGGFMASLMDTFNTMTLLSKNPGPGVTVDLHVSYLKGAKEGDDILVDSRTIRVGRKMAYMECELKHKSDGSLIARGTQTQFVGGN